MDAELTKLEIIDAGGDPMNPLGQECDRAIATAATRKALWTLQREMLTHAGTQTSTGRAWGHCAQNVALWLEMDGIAPWPPEAPQQGPEAEEETF